MKKVLFFIPTLGGGGAERVLVNLLNNLDKQKYEISLLCLFDGGINKKYLNKDIKYSYFFKNIFKGNSHLFKVFSPRLLYKMIVKEEYDVVISYLEGPTTRILGGCPFNDTKLLNWVHIECEKREDFTLSYRSQKEMINTYNKFDSTIFVSNTALSSFKFNFPEISTRFEVKYNTVDTEKIKKKSNEGLYELDFDKNKINIISVGRFTKQKGYLRLLEMVKRLKSEQYDFHLYLVGKGNLENKYEKYIRENRLNDFVTIIGYTDNPYKYVKNSDLFVCSSYKEGFSTAVTESLIVGTPVVTTLCSGMEEMLGHNEYGLITENNTESLYEGIKKIISKRETLEYYRNKALERGKAFSTVNTVNSIERLLDSY